MVLDFLGIKLIRSTYKKMMKLNKGNDANIKEKTSKGTQTHYFWNDMHSNKVAVSGDYLAEFG